MESSASTHKTHIDTESVALFLKQQYLSPISDLEFIAGGEGSQAFGFEVDGTRYVIRINRHSSRGFKKDAYAYMHFNSDSIPIPEILNIGQMQNGYYFAISKRVEGVLAKDIPKEEIVKYTTPTFEVLEAIHLVNIHQTSGYGIWGGDGQGMYTTWKEFLLKVDMYAVGNEEHLSLFETSFLEEKVWNELYSHFATLVSFCPEERWLLHGDYGADNLFVKDGHVAGVIDWEHSMYGDFLYDIAWLVFWSRDFDYQKQYQQRVEPIPYFEERLRCYQLYIGLGSLSFYAYSNQKEKYETSKKKLYSLVQQFT